MVSSISKKLIPNYRSEFLQKVNQAEILTETTNKKKFEGTFIGDIEYQLKEVDFHDDELTLLGDDSYKEQYANNSLYTGAKPYSYCFGSSNSGTSKIKVVSPNNSDVLVSVKRNNQVFRHAYIRKGAQYTFNIPNGYYQTFFYYGSGWNPEKIVNQSSCGGLKGGFVSNEQVGKSDVQSIYNAILTFKLILQENGNFQTKPSNTSEAF